MGPVPLKPKGQDNAGRHPRGGNWRGGRHRTNGIYAAGGFEIRTCASRSKIPAIPVGHFAARCFSCECLLCDSGVLCVHVCAGVSTLVWSEARGGHHVSWSNAVHPIHLREVVSLSLELGWQPESVNGLLSTHTALGVQAHVWPPLACYMAAGNQTQIFIFVQQALLPTEPSPWPYKLFFTAHIFTYRCIHTCIHTHNYIHICMSLQQVKLWSMR